MSAAIVTLHVGDAPEHEPLQPVKVAPAAGVAARVTVVPAWNFAEQPPPQWIDVPDSPPGVPVTVPFPPLVAADHGVVAIGYLRLV